MIGPMSFAPPTRIHREDRPKATLRAIYAFAKARHDWPTLDELRSFRRRLGCRATVYENLVRLRNGDLVTLRGRGTASRWVLADSAFDVIGRPHIVPAFERERVACDAAVLFLTPVRTIPSPPETASPHAIAAATFGLTVTE